MKQITTPEVLDILDIAEITLKKWRAAKDWKSFKVSKIEKRKMRYFPDRLRDFLIATNKYEYAEKLEKWLEGNAPSNPKPEPAHREKRQSIEIEHTKDDSKNIDIFKAKQLVGALLIAAAGRLRNASGSQVAFETNNISKLTNELRHLEMACLEIDEKLKRVAPVEVFQQWAARSYIQFKDNMRNLPYVAADRLAAMDDPKEIAEFLQKKVDENLNAIAGEFTLED